MLRPLVRDLTRSPFQRGGGSVDAAATAWALAVAGNGGTASSNTLGAVSAFAKSAKAAGYWTKLNRVNLFCGDQLAACMVPLKVGGGSATETNVNFVGGDYTEATGLTGNGSTKSLDTGLLQNVFTAADRHIAIYERVRPSAAAMDQMASEEAANTNKWGIVMGVTGGSSDNYVASSTASGANQGGLTLSGVGGMFVGTGTDIQASIYKNGGSVVNGAIVAATPSATTMGVFAVKRAAAFIRWSDGVLAGYSIGTGLTAGDVANYYTHMQAFQAALGRSV